MKDFLSILFNKKPIRIDCICLGNFINFAIYSSESKFPSQRSFVNNSFSRYIFHFFSDQIKDYAYGYSMSINNLASFKCFKDEDDKNKDVSNRK